MKSELDYLYEMLKERNVTLPADPPPQKRYTDKVERWMDTDEAKYLKSHCLKEYYNTLQEMRGQYQAASPKQFRFAKRPKK